VVLEATIVALSEIAQGCLVQKRIAHPYLSAVSEAGDAWAQSILSGTGTATGGIETAAEETLRLM